MSSSPQPNQQEPASQQPPSSSRVPLVLGLLFLSIVSFQAYNRYLLKDPVAVVPNCPPDVTLIGRSSWNLLHSMAFQYPDEPSQSDRDLMLHFIQAFAKFFPCDSCRVHFTDDLVKNPPQVSSRNELVDWVCQLHNRVNKGLGKPTFNCTMQRLEQRWRHGDSAQCAVDEL